MVILLPIFIFFLIVTSIFLVRRLIKILNNFSRSREENGFIESLWVYLLPAIGLYFSDQKCDDHPFASGALFTSYSIWILFSLAHFISRYQKKQLSPIMLLLVSSFMMMGVIYCAAICIHFSSNLGFLFAPLFNLSFVSPAICLVYLLRELNCLNIYLKENLEGMVVSGSDREKLFYKWIEKNQLGFSFYILAPVIALVQTFFYLMGQKPDSVISQFTDSCGYLFSYQQSCSCGGDHYLCSIAANGSSKLVKPFRLGLRQNKKIMVNRQLLIANAFENWLEDYTPRFHRMVRNTYDAMNIPVNAWSKHKRFANLLYILMKPLEWLFLFWLYLADRNPETRIAKQYLPKKDLELFIKNQNHENKN